MASLIETKTLFEDILELAKSDFIENRRLAMGLVSTPNFTKEQYEQVKYYIHIKELCIHYETSFDKAKAYIDSHEDNYKQYWKDKPINSI